MTGVAPICSAKAAKVLEDQINRSVAAGAQIVIGGKRPDPEGAFIEPTILTNVKKGMPAYDEELFGPVASVIVIPDEATAIEIANDTKYGLGGSVYMRTWNAGGASPSRSIPAWSLSTTRSTRLMTSPSANQEIRVRSRDRARLDSGFLEQEGHPRPPR